MERRWAFPRQMCDIIVVGDRDSLMAGQAVNRVIKCINGQTGVSLWFLPSRYMRLRRCNLQSITETITQAAVAARRQ